MSRCIFHNFEFNLLKYLQMISWIYPFGLIEFLQTWCQISNMISVCFVKYFRSEMISDLLLAVLHIERFITWSEVAFKGRWITICVKTSVIIMYNVRNLVLLITNVIWVSLQYLNATYICNANICHWLLNYTCDLDNYSVNMLQSCNVTMFIGWEGSLR